MSIVLDNEDKNVNIVISDDVVVGIVNNAIKEVKGVANISNRVTNTDIKDIFSKNPFQKGIKIETFENSLNISLLINVFAGYKIQDVAQSAQAAIKTAIENMTGLLVDRVDISVVGITLIKEQK